MNDLRRCRAAVAPGTWVQPLADGLQLSASTESQGHLEVEVRFVPVFRTAGTTPNRLPTTFGDW